MHHINCNPVLKDMIEMWMSSKIQKKEIDIGSGIEDLITSIQGNVNRIIIINPWPYFEKDIDGNLSYELKELIALIRKRIEHGTAVIFGGNGEIDIFGQKVETQIPTFSLLEKVLR